MARKMTSLPQPRKPDCARIANSAEPKTADYIVVVTDDGVPDYIDHFETRKEAIGSVDEILARAGYSSATALFEAHCIHISVWKRQKGRFGRVRLYSRLLQEDVQ